MAKYFMGIDVGTYESKGVIINDKAEVVCSAATPHGLENPKPHYFEHDADTVWWGDICKLTKTLLETSGLANTEIAAFGCSTLAADVLPVDENCTPLRKGILYGIDSRATEEIKYLEEYYGDRLDELWGGEELCSSDCMPKVLWIKNNEPEVYEKTYKFLTASSYITAKLTGKYVIDRYLAVSSFIPCYRPDLSIDDELARECYCRGDQLAEGHEVTDVVGYVTAEAARETGLAEGTPVITGTDDSGAEAISAGVLQPGDLMVQLGSTCYIIYCSDQLIHDDRIWEEDSLIPGRYSIDGGTNAAGALTKWMRDTFFPDLVREQEAGGENAFTALTKLAANVPAGAGGLVVLPYFSGERTPINDSEAKGIIFGLQFHHTRDQIYRAGLEGVACSVAQHIDILEEHGLKINNLMCTGGGTRNPVWLQIIADMTGHEVKTPEVTLGASYGDALMAGIGVGCFQGFPDLSRYIRVGNVYRPDPEKAGLYAKIKDIYGKLYEANKDLMHEL